MKTADFIREHHACRRGAEWALSISDDMAEVWDALVNRGNYAWLLWVVIRPGVFQDSTLRRLACRFVRETPIGGGKTVWDLLTDERSRKAVEMAERYADGKATESELYAAHYAAYAAYAAARDASYDAEAACAAAYAAASAAAYYDARAAYYAARAAVCAAALAADATYSAARAAALAADAAYCAASAAARSAYYAAAYTAQVRMVAELGNPFEKGITK